MGGGQCPSRAALGPVHSLLSCAAWGPGGAEGVAATPGRCPLWGRYTPRTACRTAGTHACKAGHGERVPQPLGVLGYVPRGLCPW